MTTRHLKPAHPVALTATFVLALAVTAAGVAAMRGLETGDPGQQAAAAATVRADVFSVRPYLQAADTPEGLSVLWQTGDAPGDDGPWSVEVRRTPEGPWVETAGPTRRRLVIDGVPPSRIHRATLTGLEPGGGFSYRVKKAGVAAFEAPATARPAPGRPHRFVVFGDCAAATVAEKAVAFQAFQAKPGYVVVTGDVVYSRGRVSEYLDHFFPVYNADAPSPDAGAPLIRSTLFVAAPGNHDLIEGDLDKYPDGLAYFYYWDQPRNGPVAEAGAKGAPLLKGSPGRQRAFLDAAGPAYPRTANFSFEAGDVHWTVLDSNTYTDWTAAPLRAWLDADLASPAAKMAAWRVVAFHHTTFHSGKAHADDQRMRLVAPSLEAGRVDLVFNGHVHNYQRTYPLKFAPGPPPADGRGKPYGPNGQVAGAWSLDRSFDGVKTTRPDGVIYVVTGAGGAKLYDPALGDDPASWQPYTAKVVSNVHSLTVVDVTPTALTVRQVADDGREVDRFNVTR